jgi:hypothetical protein
MKESNFRRGGTELGVSGVSRRGRHGNFDRYPVGDKPVTFLKTRLKWVSDWKPVA